LLLAIGLTFMWYLLYNVLLSLASPVILLMLLGKKRCRRGLLERLGLSGLSRLSGWGQNTPNKPDEPHKPVIWLHAVSLGEVTAAVPLVRALARRYPAHRFVVSTVTETGREAVEHRLAGTAEHCYAPLDFPWAVSAFVNRLDPRLYLFVETELWPNLLRTLRRRGVPTVLVNGRVSSRSFARQRMGFVRPLYRQVLESVTLCLMQSDRDAERIVALGADPARVRRTGNIKFDQPLPEVATTGPLSREVLRLAQEEDLFVAGSTHPGEEEQLIACYQTLVRRFPSLVLLLAPRHIERASQVEAMIRAKGLAVVKRSRLSADPTSASATTMTGPRVILLDTRGELASLYRWATLTFVGGTLVPVGGHNLLEPAVWGRPVWFGPYTDHCQEVADLLVQAGGGRQVRDGEQLAAELAARLDDRTGLARMGEAAQRAVLVNRGALDRSLELIASVLDEEKEHSKVEVPSSAEKQVGVSL
jgi:3-deoxy-D-manno-octulosonic-acid transferase